MKNPFFSIQEVAASGTIKTSSFNLNYARTISVTVQIDCGAALDADTTVNVYYSPDGNNWDTINYTSFTLAFDAGNTVQRTVLIDTPEHGALILEIVNGSAADTLDNVYCWYSIQSWEHIQEHR